MAARGHFRMGGNACRGMGCGPERVGAHYPAGSLRDADAHSRCGAESCKENNCLRSETYVPVGRAGAWKTARIGLRPAGVVNPCRESGPSPWLTSKTPWLYHVSICAVSRRYF